MSSDMRNYSDGYFGYTPKREEKGVTKAPVVRPGTTSGSVTNGVKVGSNVISIIPKDMSVKNSRCARLTLMQGCQHKIGFSEEVMLVLKDMSNNDRINIACPAGLEVAVLKFKEDDTPDVGVYYAIKQLHPEWLNQFENSLLEVSNIVTYTLEFMKANGTTK